jgi:hypothetical protein
VTFDPNEFVREQRDQWHAQAKAGSVPNRQLLDRKDPVRTARAFAAAHYERDGKRTLLYHRGDFYAWTSSHYAAMPDDEIRAAFYHHVADTGESLMDGMTEDHLIELLMLRRGAAQRKLS